MSREITTENLLRSFPYALANDKDKDALAATVSDELQQLFNDNDKLIIYANIDKLDERLLDIIANDYDVKWYLYDGTLETKRAQIASCFYIHRHLGTKMAMVFALSDICPGTEVEEWQDYGGKPYHFRILLDVTEQRMPISQKIVDSIISVVKPARSVLEGDSVIYRSRNTILLSERNGFVFFNSRMCGTYPNVSRQGRIHSETILVGTDGIATVFSTARSGEIQVGTIPTSAVEGGIEGSEISFATNGEAYAYSARVCGTPNGTLL